MSLNSARHRVFFVSLSRQFGGWKMVPDSPHRQVFVLQTFLMFIGKNTFQRETLVIWFSFKKVISM